MGLNRHQYCRHHKILFLLDSGCVERNSKKDLTKLYALHSTIGVKLLQKIIIDKTHARRNSHNANRQIRKPWLCSLYSRKQRNNPLKFPGLQKDAER